MKHTTVSIRNFSFETNPSIGITSTSVTFEKVLDFSPHNEVYLGQIPMLYTFSKEFQNTDNWVEVKDGFFTLIPFLMRANHNEKVVVPIQAKYFIDHFHYSQLRYKNNHYHSDYCYIHLDYYQDLSKPENLLENFQKILRISKQHDDLRLCISIHASASTQNNLTPLFLQAIKSLPENCRIIPNNELFELQDFGGRSVYLLTDDDFILKSPWENIFASRNGIINGIIETSSDEEVLRFPVSHYADKVIFYKTHSERNLSPDIKDYLENLLQMLQSSRDYLNPDYLRQMREALRLIRSTHA